eukprot:GHVU01125974.1.p1 GENE.GHVU01125974.1~~GHVU01125974.1.p1  ORF type:complete len:270 (-),score=81.59 GHVU01125974.1:122-889(-)
MAASAAATAATTPTTTTPSSSSKEVDNYGPTTPAVSTTDTKPTATTTYVECVKFFVIVGVVVALVQLLCVLRLAVLTGVRGGQYDAEQSTSASMRRLPPRRQETQIWSYGFVLVSVVFLVLWLRTLPDILSQWLGGAVAHDQAALDAACGGDDDEQQQQQQQWKAVAAAPAIAATGGSNHRIGNGSLRILRDPSYVTSSHQSCAAAYGDSSSHPCCGGDAMVVAEEEPYDADSMTLSSCCVSDVEDASPREGMSF